MEETTSIWQIGFISLLAGALIGALLYRLLSPSVKQAGQIKADLDQTRGELASYKASVGQHFDKTSELVKDLTQNYVRVYQHLAEGAQTLGDSNEFPSLLERHQDKASITTGETTTADSRFAFAETAADFTESMDEHVGPSDGQANDESDPESETLPPPEIKPGF
ncbi:MAG: YhcB family protein [Gammaproteobacteria bacterium]|nr:YhcB family protein [Gammaproteobacteria bacterium]